MGEEAAGHGSREDAQESESGAQARNQANNRASGGKSTLERSRLGENQVQAVTVRQGNTLKALWSSIGLPEV